MWRHWRRVLALAADVAQVIAALAAVWQLMK
jgi:hypothetical protein